MVNVFGERGESDNSLVKNINTIKKVTVSDGIYKNYIKEIDASYELGFTPYRTRHIDGLVYMNPLRRFGDEVWCLDDRNPNDVSKKSIKTDGNATITYAIQANSGDDGKISAIIGAEGVPGPRGPQGLRGERGLPGPIGDKGIKGDRGEIGPVGERGIQGERGERGSIGKTGPKGDPGVKGDTGGQGPRGEIGPIGPTGARGLKGDRGEIGERGLEGAKGQRGERGLRGTPGPIGPTGQIDYEYMAVATLRFLPDSYRTKVYEESKKKATSTFIASKQYIEFFSPYKIKTWKDIGGVCTATQNNGEYMARYKEEKGVGYLNFSAATYTVHLTPSKECCMFIIYRLKDKRRTGNDYIMIGDGDSSNPQNRTIGFDGSHTKLLITTGHGRVIQLDRFPKTSPLTKDVWHCLCIKWTAEGSSVWLNSRKVVNFSASDDDFRPTIILGGQFLFDSKGFHGDMKLFEVYNTSLRDDEIFMIQNKYCNLYKIKSDDGDFLYPIGSSLSLSDFCSWLPNTMLDNLRRKEEIACYLIRDKQKDIKRGQSGLIETWISRGEKKYNLEGKVPAKDLVTLPNGKGYALKFTNTYYQVTGVRSFMNGFGYGYVCITFQTRGDKEQALLSSFDADNPDEPYSEITVSKTQVQLRWVVSPNVYTETIQYDCTKWTTFFVVWNANIRLHRGTYLINGNGGKKSGKFDVITDDIWIDNELINVGCRGHYNINPFIGDIAGIELYTSNDEKLLPSSLKELIINDQMIFADKENISPLLKKKKII